MRIIAAFLSIAGLAAAQPSQLDLLEKEAAAHPEVPGTRNRILNVLSDPNVAAALPYDRVIETRRRNILWLIEHHPDAPGWLPGDHLIPLRGAFADPEGYAESADLWNRAAWRQAARVDTIANAAIYLKATDRMAARNILDFALAKYPRNAALERALGIVDAAALAGLDGVGERGQFTTSASLRDSPEAAAARQEIEASRSAFVLTGAAQMLNGGIQNPFQLNFGDDDVLSLAERWLRRAVEIEPLKAEFKTQLSAVLRNEANRAEDPHERLRLFSEAMTLAPDGAKPSFLPDLAQAEFEAGEDDDARRDAGRALDAAEAVKANVNFSAQLIHRGNTILGRVALAHGDVAQARARLAASLKLPGIPGEFRSNGPDLGLAEDLADAGERDAVIDFLENSRQFWLYDRGRIDHYIKSLKAGRKRDAFAFYQPSVFEIVNRPAPDFSVRDLDGREWTRASLDKRTALIFWNTRCAACADQIAQFSNEARALDMRLVAIDIGDDPAAVRAFAAAHRIAVPVLYGADSMARTYRADTLPSVVVIDAGRIANYQMGPAPNPRQVLESGEPVAESTPVALAASVAEGKIKLAWRPSARAESYVVEWEARDGQGWPSDRDGYLRVIATRDTRTELDSAGTVRWRVSAVRSGAKSEPTDWQVIHQ